jgi:hypothetical protein
MESNMNYGEILSKAWKIIWKHKVLWIFGLLASCSSNNGNSSNFRSSSRGGSLPPELQDMVEWMISPTGIAVLISAFLLLAIICMAIGSIGTIGLKKGTRLGDQDVEKMTFSELWAESTPFFGRVFGLNLLLFFIGLILMLVFVGLPVYFMVIQRNFEPEAVLSMTGLFFILVCCLIVPISLLVGILTNMWITAMVLDDLTLAEGLARGWNVFTGNFWKLVGLSLILFLISLGIGFLIAIPMVAIMMPVMFAAQTMRSGLSAIWLPLVCMLALSPILWFLRAVLTSYMEAVWTLAYMRLTAPSAGQDVLLPTGLAQV